MKSCKDSIRRFWFTIPARALREKSVSTLFFSRTPSARPFETLIDCAALIYGGVPERFPKLRDRFSRMRLRLGALLDGSDG